MKNRFWWFQLPIILLFATAYWIVDQGLQGQLKNPFLQERVYPSLQRVATFISDSRFTLRGDIAPKNKIVIVEVDDDSIDRIGRWPWHRDVIAKALDRIVASGAKVVGLDIVFSEPDHRVSPELREFLTQKNFSSSIDRFETDHALATTIFSHANQLVLGFTNTATCRPSQGYRGLKDGVPQFDTAICPIDPLSPELAASIPRNFDASAIKNIQIPAGFDFRQTPIWTSLSILPNLPQYTEYSMHTGYFDAQPDMDHVIRRSQLIEVISGKFYPSLALQMALTGLGEELFLTLDSKSSIKSMFLGKSGREIPVTPSGSMEINFRGRAHTFQHVSISEFLNDSPRAGESARGLASSPLADTMKDAYVLIGVTALGVFDMRAFPTDSNAAGVEGHANILDNLLAGDMLVPGYRSKATYAVFLLMTFGAILFAYFLQKLESIPALILFVAVMLGVGLTDFKFAFQQQISVSSAFFYLEYIFLFGATLAVRYVIEEKNKKFVRTAFTKYVAPAVVDQILKDPTKLTVGGVKRDLTIMFSDIRSFTTFSEKMDAKLLSSFLNDYLGTMTRLVFANEGTLDKYIGDAVMAFWGAPLDQPYHAANACRTAVLMMRALNEQKARYLEQYGVDVNIGIGLNSGEVSVGNMGSSDNFAYTVIGDHVNLASRLEGLTKEYRVSILTTRFTFDLIDQAKADRPPHRILDFGKVKGKKKAVELIQVLESPIPEEALREFQEGRSLYTAQKWDQAKDSFTRVSQLMGKSDGVSEMFIERCDYWKANPPEENWDGSWEMHTK